MLRSRALLKRSCTLTDAILLFTLLAMGQLVLWSGLRAEKFGYNLGSNSCGYSNWWTEKTEAWPMILDLKGKKVVVIGGRNAVAGAIDKAVALEGADVVIWLRKWYDDGDEAKVLPITELEISSPRPNGASPHTSLWRQSMGGHKSYW
jgi:hypothetical protein